MPIISQVIFCRYQPDSCLNPACDNDLDLCPGRVVCEPIPPDWFEILETICVIVFTADYILRVASCSFVPARISGVSPMALSSMDNPTDINDPEFEFIERYRDPEYEELWWVSIYRYVLQPLNIIDLVAVVPFYIELVFSSGSSLSIIRILRLARVIRLAKSGKGRFTKGLKILSNTLITSAPMNAFLLAVALIIFVVCGAIGFLIEGGEFKVSHEYPNGTYMRTDLLGEHLEPTPFISVLHGMYWSIVTSTTVGYGDMYTTTAGGRIFTCACTFLGIIVIAMPVTVLGTHFSKEYEKEYMVEEEQEAVRRQSVRRLSLAKMELSFMNDNGSMRPTLGMSGSQLTSHLSSIEGDISICPEVKHAEEAVTRLEALSNELQRSIAEIKFELATHKAVIRKATAAALIRMESSVSGVDDCVEEDSKNSNEFRQADTNPLSEDSTVNDMPLNEWKPKSMSVISQRYVEEAKL